MANLRADNLTGTGGRNAIDGSLFFDGSGRLSVPNSADVRVGSNDFTIEAWIRAENPGDWTTVLGMWDSSATRRTYALQRKKADSKLYFYVSADGGSTIGATNTQFASGGDVTLGDWHHVAGVRDGNTIRAYLNGVEVGNASFTASILNNTTDALFIGDTEVTAGGEAFNGHMSNVRMIKGTCLYPSGTTFTPPTEKLKAIDGTVLLCCQDSDDPTQEATGKTITGYGNYYGNTTTNLITNGDFGTGDLTGWTTDQATTSVVSGSARIVPNSSVNGALYQQFTTVAGKQYKATMRVTNTPTHNYARLHLGTGTDIDSANKYLYSGSDVQNVGQGTYSLIFTPTGTTTTLWLEVGGGNQVTTDFDDISVVGHNVGPAPKVLPPVGVDEGVVVDGYTKINSPGVMYFPTGDTAQRGRGRGLYTLGYSHPSGGERSEIEYFNIQSQGNAIQFGDLTATKYNLGSGSSATRGVFCGGYDGSSSPDTDINNIEYVTIATTGNALDFGDRTQVGRAPASASSATRVCMATAFTGAGYQDTIDYITTASTGDAINFGDLGAARTSMCNASASPTRGVFAGGYEVSPVAASVNTMEYITMATTGDATNFGDLTTAARDSYGGTASSNTRGCIVLANATPSGLTALMNYVTIATTGDAAEFGNLTDGRDHLGSCSNSIRGVFIGGRTPNYTNIMDYINIATTGNASDFGDISYAAGTSALGAALSDSHGGLS